jgi:hypothetical protein
MREEDEGNAGTFGLLVDLRELCIRIGDEHHRMASQLNDLLRQVQKARLGHSPNASKSTRKRFASWAPRAYSCARWSPPRAGNRQVLECPVLYRNGAPEEIRTPDLQIRS